MEKLQQGLERQDGHWLQEPRMEWEGDIHRAHTWDRLGAGIFTQPLSTDLLMPQRRLANP